MSGQLKVKRRFGTGVHLGRCRDHHQPFVNCNSKQMPMLLEPNTSEVYDWRGERTALEI